MNAEHEMMFGCIPNRETPQAMQALKEAAAPWDASDVPPVTQWESYASFLDESANVETPPLRDWTTIEKVSQYFTPSQSSRPNCAGFGMANAAMVTLLNQRVCGYSEQEPGKFNPMVTWLISKGGSAWGGQSISAISQAGNKYGNYLAQDVGDYTTSTSCYSKREEFAERAKTYQIGIAPYEGKDLDLPLYIVKSLSLKTPRAVILGNGFSVSSTPQKDENGVPCVRVSGSWSHAIAAVKYFIVNGKQYVVVMNSHGEIYESYRNIPAFCFILPLDEFERFMSSSFCDASFVTYTEAPYDLNVLPTLNPEVV